LGPIRACMSEMTLRSNQIMSMTDTIRTAKATTTLMTTINSTAQVTPRAKADPEGQDMHDGGERGCAHGVSIRTSTTEMAGSR